jgi:prepilin peptidase CpaA
MLFASVIGGALTLILIGIRQVPLPEWLMEQTWISRLHAASSGVPYGVALAAGALIFLLPVEDFLRHATG